MKAGATMLGVALVAGGCSKIEGLLGDEPEATAEVAEAEVNGVVPASSVEELIVALGPQRTIELAPGEYRFATGASYEGLSAYYDDGRIVGVRDLKIAADAGDVDLVQPDPTRPVLDFHDAQGLELENVRLMHAVAGADGGAPVLRVVGSERVRLKDLDLSLGPAGAIEVIRSEDVRVEGCTIHECRGQLAAVVESRDVGVRRTTFERNGAPDAPLVRGFEIAKSTVTFEDVVVADNLGTFNHADRSGLFHIDADRALERALPKETTRRIEVPQHSKIRFVGGRIEDNRFWTLGAVDNRLRFDGTRWSRNTMLAPEGVVPRPDGPALLFALDANQAVGKDNVAGQLITDAEITLLDELPPGTEVLGRSACEYGTRVVVDHAVIGASDYKTVISDLGAGATVELKGLFYTEVFLLPHPFDRCQLQFDLGAPDGGVRVPLGRACFDDSELRRGPCTPAIAAAPVSDATMPIRVADLRREPQRSDAGITLEFAYTLDVHADLPSPVPIQIEERCRGGDGVHVVAGEVYPPIAADLEPGESVLRSHTMYLPRDLESCDITFRSPIGGNGRRPGDGEVLHRACWRPPELLDEPCT